MICLFDSVSVECIYSFWKNSKYLDYFSAEVGKIDYFLKKLKMVFCNRDVWKWFGLTSFEAMFLFWG